jgi:hypothetical protein
MTRPAARAARTTPAACWSLIAAIASGGSAEASRVAAICSASAVSLRAHTATSTWATRCQRPLLLAGSPSAGRVTGNETSVMFAPLMIVLTRFRESGWLITAGRLTLGAARARARTAHALLVDCRADGRGGDRVDGGARCCGDRRLGAGHGRKWRAAAGDRPARARRPPRRAAHGRAGRGKRGRQHRLRRADRRAVADRGVARSACCR